MAGKTQSNRGIRRDIMIVFDDVGDGGELTASDIYQVLGPNRSEDSIEIALDAMERDGLLVSRKIGRGPSKQKKYSKATGEDKASDTSNRSSILASTFPKEKPSHEEQAEDDAAAGDEAFPGSKRLADEVFPIEGRPAVVTGEKLRLATLDEKLAELQETLQRPHVVIEDLDQKLNVLDRLSAILDPEIGEVLHDIADDLQKAS